jgi:hypothetical protein
MNIYLHWTLIALAYVAGMVLLSVLGAYVVHRIRGPRIAVLTAAEREVYHVHKAAQDRRRAGR